MTTSWQPVTEYGVAFSTGGSAVSAWSLFVTFQFSFSTKFATELWWWGLLFGLDCTFHVRRKRDVNGAPDDSRALAY